MSQALRAGAGGVEHSVPQASRKGPGKQYEKALGRPANTACATNSLASLELLTDATINSCEHRVSQALHKGQEVWSTVCHKLHAKAWVQEGFRAPSQRYKRHAKA